MGPLYVISASGMLSGITITALAHFLPVGDFFLGVLQDCRQDIVSFMGVHACLLGIFGFLGVLHLCLLNIHCFQGILRVCLLDILCVLGVLHLCLLGILCGEAFFSSRLTKATTAGMNTGTGRSLCSSLTECCGLHVLWISYLSIAPYAASALYIPLALIDLLAVLHRLHQYLPRATSFWYFFAFVCSSCRTFCFYATFFYS